MKGTKLTQSQLGFLQGKLSRLTSEGFSDMNNTTRVTNINTQNHSQYPIQTLRPVMLNDSTLSDYQPPLDDQSDIPYLPTYLQIEGGSTFSMNLSTQSLIPSHISDLKRRTLHTDRLSQLTLASQPKCDQTFYKNTKGQSCITDINDIIDQMEVRKRHSKKQSQVIEDYMQKPSTLLQCQVIQPKKKKQLESYFYFHNTISSLNKMIKSKSQVAIKQHSKPERSKSRDKSTTQSTTLRNFTQYHNIAKVMEQPHKPMESQRALKKTRKLKENVTPEPIIKSGKCTNRGNGNRTQRVKDRSQLQGGEAKVLVQKIKKKKDQLDDLLKRFNQISKQ